MRRLALLVLASLTLSACGGGSEGAEQAAAPASDGVQGLDNVLSLRSAFEADAGKTRLLLLFSPT